MPIVIWKALQKKGRLSGNNSVLLATSVKLLRFSRSLDPRGNPMIRGCDRFYFVISLHFVLLLSQNLTVRVQYRYCTGTVRVQLRYSYRTVRICAFWELIEVVFGHEASLETCGGPPGCSEGSEIPFSDCFLVVSRQLPPIGTVSVR